MRAILLILIIAVVAVFVTNDIGLIDISQIRGARVPQVEASDGAIRTRGGQSPAFEVQTGSVGVGTREANVAVPEVEVRRGETSVKVPVVEVRRPQESEQNAAR